MLQKINIDIFTMNIEKPQTLVNFNSFQKFIKCYIMSQDNQLTRIALHLRKNECRDYHLKHLMQRGDFIKKTHNLGSIPENTILVKVDVVGLYPSIPDEIQFKALREILDKREEHSISTNELIRMIFCFEE